MPRTPTSKNHVKDPIATVRDAIASLNMLLKLDKIVVREKKGLPPASTLLLSINNEEQIKAMGKTLTKIILPHVKRHIAEFTRRSKA